MNFIRCSMSSVIKVKVPLLTFSWSLCDKLAYFYTCLWYVSLVHKLLGDCWAHENNVLYTWKQCSLQTMNLWLSIKLLSNSCLVSLALLLGHQTAFASMKCVSLYSDKSSLIGSSTVSELLSTLMSLRNPTITSSTFDDRRKASFCHLVNRSYGNSCVSSKQKNFIRRSMLSVVKDNTTVFTLPWSLCDKFAYILPWWPCAYDM